MSDVSKTTHAHKTHETHKQPAQGKQKGIGLGGKVLTIATSVVATPLSMVHGFGATIWNIGKCVVALIKERGVKSEPKTHIQSGTVTQQEAVKKPGDPVLVKSKAFDPGHPESVTYAIHCVVVSLLRMVPFLGMQLAEHLNNTGSLKGFTETHAFASFIESHKLGIQHQVFNDAGRAKLTPNIEQLKKDVQDNHPGAKCRDLTIKSIDINGIEHSHDANLIIRPGGKASDPVVFMYHGNGMTRDQCNYQAMLDKEYNVCLIDYSGDSKKGKASESEMRRDAEADIKHFVEKLGVKEISIYGISLGGAQAANCAQILSKLQNDPEQNEKFKDVKVPFVFLDQTFTKSAEVVGNVAKNITNSGFIGSSIEASAQSDVDVAMTHDPAADGLNTEGKMESFKKTDGFKDTKIIIVGTKNDMIMGGKLTKKEYDPGKNMSHRIAKAAIKNFGDNVENFMIEARYGGRYAAGHCTPFSEDHFVMDGEIKRENPILQAIPEAPPSTGQEIPE